MIIETILFAIGIATAISAISFIGKSASGITESLGLQQYITSTVVLSFVIALPILLIFGFSAFYNISTFGIAAAIGFSITTATLVMGIFLLKNNVEVEYEGYRNATFVWSSALLLLITSFDGIIDRMDAVFMIMLFVFYTLYMYYRTTHAKEYTFLKAATVNKALFPIAIIALGLSCFMIVGSSMIFSRAFGFSVTEFSLIFIGAIFALPILYIVKSTFKSARLTFDNLLGNIVVNLTLVVGLISFVRPTIYSNFSYFIFPLLLLNIVCMFFAIINRAFRRIGQKTGALLIGVYIFYVVYTIYTLVLSLS